MSNDKAEILTEADLTDMQGRHAEYFTDGTLVALNLDSVVSTVRKMAGLLEEVLVADGWWQQTDPQKVDDACKRQIHAMGQVQAILARYKGEKL